MVGAGSVFHVSRLDASKINWIDCVEPNQFMRKALKMSIDRTRLYDRVTYIPCKLEDGETLSKYGVKTGKIDTIICLDWLCSVENLDEAMAAAYRLLRHGGKLIVWQHEQHTSRAGRLWQGKDLSIKMMSSIELTPQACGTSFGRWCATAT